MADAPKIMYNGGELAKRGWKETSPGSSQWVDPYSGRTINQTDAIAHIVNLDANNLNPATGAPVRPEFESQIDPATGLLKSQYQLQEQLIDPNSLEGLSSIKKEALRTGPSQWAQTMLAKQQGDRAGALNNAAAASNQAAAQGRSSLAMRGGLSSGARERLATQSSRDLLSANQGVNKEATANRYGLLGQDEGNRLSMLNQYATGEGQLANVNAGNKAKTQQFNIQEALKDKQAQQAFKMDNYKEQLDKYGANKQAEATAHSGGGK